jgi:hypothetical protein
MFGVPSDAKKGRWRSREQYVRRQPLCGEARQDSSKHGEYSAGLLHQLAKQGLELVEEGGELRPEISRLGSGGDDVGIRGGRLFGGWHRGLRVKQRREVANVASVNVLSGHARSGRLRSGGGGAPSCLKAAVDITPFIICWVGPAAKGTRRRGSGIFGAHCRIMVTTTFNTDKWSGAIGFSMPVRLAPSALYDRSFLSRRFDSNLHVT